MTFDSMYGIKHILLAYSLLKEIDSTIGIRYKNTKSPHGYRNFFKLVTGILQRDPLAQNIFVIFQRLYIV